MVGTVGLEPTCLSTAELEPAAYAISPRARVYLALTMVTDSKRCFTCQTTKPASAFNVKKRAKDGLQSDCKECSNRRARGYYEANPGAYLERNRETRRQNRENYYAWLAQRACIDCGETDPIVLDCDHVRGAKLDNVTTMVADGRAWKLIEEELAKCDVRCSNCHRKKTARERGYRLKRSISG